jgi:hypothetical protein
MTAREGQIKYWVDCFNLRHYERGKGPSEEEIDKWMKTHIWGLDRPLMRAIKKAIVEAAASRYGESK